MEFENNELKALSQFRMYVKISKVSRTIICNESGISAPTYRTIMKDQKYIPTKKVRNKIGFFMNNKLTELRQLIDC